MFGSNQTSNLSYNLTSDDIRPLYVTFEIMNVSRVTMLSVWSVLVFQCSIEHSFVLISAHIFPGFMPGKNVCKVSKQRVIQALPIILLKLCCQQLLKQAVAIELY